MKFTTIWTIMNIWGGNNMEFLVNYWYLIVALIAVIVVVIALIVKFFNMPTQDQVKTLKEWLVWACMQAEKDLGQKTGKLKLRMVYDMFLTKFPWLAKVITFEQFSKYVDEALERFKKMLESNVAVQAIVEEPPRKD